MLATAIGIPFSSHFSRKRGPNVGYLFAFSQCKTTLTKAMEKLRFLSMELVFQSKRPWCNLGICGWYAEHFICPWHWRVLVVSLFRCSFMLTQNTFIWIRANLENLAEMSSREILLYRAPQLWIQDSNWALEGTLWHGPTTLPACDGMFMASLVRPLSMALQHQSLCHSMPKMLEPMPLQRPWHDCTMPPCPLLANLKATNHAKRGLSQVGKCWTMVDGWVVGVGHWVLSPTAFDHLVGLETAQSMLGVLWCPSSNIDSTGIFMFQFSPQNLP